MSRDWTPEELAAASAAMKASGHMSYEEFCEDLKRKTAEECFHEQKPGKPRVQWLY